MAKQIDHVYDWIWKLGDIPGVIPPFCVELNFIDGANYFLHSIHSKDNKTKSMVMRVWDFRSFNQDDIEDLKAKLNNYNSREQLEDTGNIHPKLDWADIHLHLGNINYVIEYNDRLFPREERKRLMGLLGNAEKFE